MNTTAVGRIAEDAVATWLAANGLRIIERNARTRFYELDIIAADGETIIFVEVKYRRSRAYGGGVAAISANKQRRLLAGAQAWLMEKGALDRPIRFDVIEVCGQPQPITITHIPNCLVLDSAY